jgi:hypothetical protein
MTDYAIGFFAGIALMGYVCLFIEGCKAVWNGDWLGASMCVLSLFILL